MIMDYKKMIKDYADNGGSVDKMWASVDITEDAMDYIKDIDPEKYECLMRKLSEALYGKHYSEEMARADVAKMHYIGKDGAEHHGAYWTIEEIDAATANKSFPKGTTKWDVFVAYNAFGADLNAVLSDADIVKAAYAFWFDDEDWKTDGKIWDYMSANK